MTLTRTITALALCGTLAACGGAKTGGTVTYDPVAVSDGLTITDANDGIIRVFRSGSLISSVTDDKVGDLDQLAGPVTIRRNGSNYTVRAVNGDTYAVASANVTNAFFGDPVFTGIAFGRREAVDLPQSGIAEMEGNYKGILVDNSVVPNLQVTRYFVEGKAYFEADFDDGSVYGEISERELVEPGSFANVNAPVQGFSFRTLEITPEGTFSSVLVRDSFPLAASPIRANDGTIAGVLGNDPNNGPRVAGVVELEHAFGTSGTLTEVGAFSADTTTVIP